MSEHNISRMVRARHSSLEMPDPEIFAKKKHHHQDMLTKARNKLFNFSDSLKKATAEEDTHPPKRTMTQATLDYFFKHASHKTNPKKTALQKQNSVGAYPIRIEITEDCDHAIHRNRPATICGDKISEGSLNTAALALERPRKKLSFREPEITGYATKRRVVKNSLSVPEFDHSNIHNNNSILHRSSSFDDYELESQAMRVVRTIGQAFEVCHKLSINAPENDHDEQDTLTQDLLSDRFSDINSDKPKKDLMSEGGSDKMSLPPDDHLYLDNNNGKKHQQLDILPPPPTNTITRKSPLTLAETYASPHSDALTTGSVGSGGGSLPPPGSALSVHHELQLMREQLEQQSQQTQAAMAQLQLAREQLAAEQSARLEAQARTHQLLIHNRELLDHIAALVSHLGGDKGQPQSPPHVTMPQQHQGSSDTYTDLSETGSIDNSVLHTLTLNPQGLIENRAVTSSCLPTSPALRLNPTGTNFNFNFPYQSSLEAAAFEAQLLQRLQNLPNYTPPYYNNYNQSFGLYQPPPMINNNNYTLQPPPQKKLPPSPLTMRHSYTGTPVGERGLSPARTEPSRQKQDQYIKPLSQMGTITTTDADGRVRVIVPVPPDSNEDQNSNLFSNLRLHDDLRLSGPPITRSTSEKVPNRSELMSQVQRTMWARHTTK